MTLGYGIFCILFATVGLCLNLTVALVIALDKRMHNATYLFMIQLALGDAEAILGIVLGPGALMIAGVRDPSNMFVKICAYMDACGFRISVFMMVLVAFTRWAHFSKYPFLNMFFTNKNYVIICAFFWISLHLFYSPFIWYPRAFTSLGDDSGAYIYTNSTVSQIFKYFDETGNYATAGLQILFNSLSLILVLKMRKQVMSPELRAKNKREIKLFIQCGIESSVFILFCIFYYYSVYSENNELWLDVSIEFLLFLNHIDCAILYLCFNQRLRSFIINSLKKPVYKIANISGVVDARTSSNARNSLVEFRIGKYAFRIWGHGLHLGTS